jgi:hypothetical protein
MYLHCSASLKLKNVVEISCTLARPPIFVGTLPDLQFLWAHCPTSNFCGHIARPPIFVGTLPDLQFLWASCPTSAARPLVLGGALPDLQFFVVPLPDLRFLWFRCPTSDFFVPMHHRQCKEPSVPLFGLRPSLQQKWFTYC